LGGNDVIVKDVWFNINFEFKNLVASEGLTMDENGVSWESKKN
jgi:hypothetical protein